MAVRLLLPKSGNVVSFPSLSCVPIEEASMKQIVNILEKVFSNDTKTMNSAPRNCHMSHRSWNALNHQVKSTRICQPDLHLDWFSNNPNQLVSILELSPISSCRSQCMHSKYSTKMQLHMISFNLSLMDLPTKFQSQ